MTVSIAVFNVENLFSRPKAFNQATWALGEPIVSAASEFNTLIAQDQYSAADKQTMIDLLTLLDVYRVNNAGILRRNRSRNPRWAWFRKNRGSFDVDRTATGVEITADGRNDWIGWVELATETTDEIATRMTARVIQDLDADIIGMVEAEDRPSLVRFNKELLGGMYDKIMLVDGNDTRGIDVGIMVKADWEIASITSHVDIMDVTGHPLFSRDCPRYECVRNDGLTIQVLLNHLKSQSGGGDAKRERQANRVAAIAADLAAAGHHVVVMGDLNEGPAAEGQLPPNIGTLFNPGGPLHSVFNRDDFKLGPRPGTWQSCGIRNRFDYILTTQGLFDVLTEGEIFRKGLWGTPTNVNPPAQWDIYQEITGSEHSASDHAAVTATFNL